jgi:two-component system chemotaxis response regulator CheB
MVVADSPIRVVAADDSALVRMMLARLFSMDDTASNVGGNRVELCASVADGRACVRATRALQPDLVLLDLEMPGLSGLDTIVLLRQEWPDLPILMFSAYTARGAAATMEALARGATEYVTKPSGFRNADDALAALSAELLPKVVALALQHRPKRAHGRITERDATETDSVAGVVGIGVSTGGPSTLEALLPRLPRDFGAPVMIVQHMPKLFTSALAERLDRCCALPVLLGVDGAEAQPGSIWVAPGDSHMEIAIRGGKPRIVLSRGDPEQHCRPAVDPLFRSLARCFGDRVLGVVLTGMGADGLEGSRAIVTAGGTVLVQDEASSAVWGMPGRVAQAGLASAVLPIEGLAEAMMQRTSILRRNVPYGSRSSDGMHQRESIHGAH